MQDKLACWWTCPQTPRVKCIKMKLFEQPLEKLFNPRAMKQLHSAIEQPGSAKPKRSASVACLRKFSLDANNNRNSYSPQVCLSQRQRQQLMLAVLPQPIRNLLHELYHRGPSTVGIFRKSPNAKHCKELRQKLESDSQSSIEQFQVTVIASVFKVSTSVVVFGSSLPRIPWSSRGMDLFICFAPHYGCVLVCWSIMVYHACLCVGWFVCLFVV